MARLEAALDTQEFSASTQEAYLASLHHSSVAASSTGTSTGVPGSSELSTTITMPDKHAQTHHQTTADTSTLDNEPDVDNYYSTQATNTSNPSSQKDDNITAAATAAAAPINNPCNRTINMNHERQSPSENEDPSHPQKDHFKYLPRKTSARKMHR